MEINKPDVKYNPHSKYPYFHYDSEGDGFVFFRTEIERDESANVAIQNYLDVNDGWDEGVEGIITGVISGRAAMVDVEIKPENLDEANCDEEGCWWDSDYKYKCNYQLHPLGYICPSTKQLK
jgi:hypothetical protein